MDVIFTVVLITLASVAVVASSCVVLKSLSLTELALRQLELRTHHLGEQSNRQADQLNQFHETSFEWYRYRLGLAKIQSDADRPMPDIDEDIRVATHEADEWSPEPVKFDPRAEAATETY